jgi:hypothetical protein
MITKLVVSKSQPNKEKGERGTKMTKSNQEHSIVSLPAQIKFFKCIIEPFSVQYKATLTTL